uniref:Carboxypeptidase n=1 Tax=Oryza brachyantha TaxID=4533 RepID=J3LBV4_ORYBR
MDEAGVGGGGGPNDGAGPLSLDCYPAAGGGYSEQEADRVAFLPGQPTSPQVSQFSGYITVNSQNGRPLFYWFFEAQALPSQKPLLLWLNGGCYGSIIYFSFQFVPFSFICANCPYFNKDVNLSEHSELAGMDLGLSSTNLLGTKNLLFLESPVGVGFSYANTSSDLTKLNDGFVECVCTRRKPDWLYALEPAVLFNYCFQKMVLGISRIQIYSAEGQSVPCFHMGVIGLWLGWYAGQHIFILEPFSYWLITFCLLFLIPLAPWIVKQSSTISSTVPL